MSVIRIAGWFLNNRVLKGRRESVGSLASTFSDKAATVRSRWPAWFRRYGLVLAVYLAGACGLTFSQGFLNFAQTGCSYVPGLSLLLLAIYLSVTGGEKPEPSSTRAWGARVTLAGAVGLWFPYVLSVPAALASPLLVFTPDRRRWRFVGQGAVAFALASAVMYGAAAVLQGIYTVAGFTEWIASN